MQERDKFYGAAFNRNIYIANRHDMLYLSDSCREYALANVNTNRFKSVKDLIANIILSGAPAIVKAQENLCDGFLEVGFSSCIVKDGVRVRVTSVIPLDGILGVISPFDAIRRVESCRNRRIRKAIEEISQLAEECGLEAGLYGSCALELVTGQPFIIKNSDVDICLRQRGNVADISKFYNAANLVSRRNCTRFDFEILCIDGAGVKLAELLSYQHTVMCKSTFGPEIRLKASVI